MIWLECADIRCVSQTSIRSIEEMDRELRTLGSAHALAAAGNLRLVIGPGGVFVVGLATGNAGIGHEVAVASRSTRDVLADHLPYAPFVEAVVIDDDEIVSHDEANIVPSDLLVAAFGGHCLAPEMIALLVKQLRSGALSPWHPLDADDLAERRPQRPADEQVAMDLAFLDGHGRLGLSRPGT